MKKISNKRLAFSILIISVLSLTSVEIFVRFILSNYDLALMITSFSSMVVAVLMILTLIMFVIIFIFRLILKKKNCYGRSVSIISIITLIMILSTAIMMKEESKYYHTININWSINLPRGSEEIYYKDSGASFLGDGERYSIFQYENLEEINSLLQWEDKNDEIETLIKDTLDKLGVSKEYYPGFDVEVKCFYIIKEDKSELYIILDSDLKKIYIVENFL